jgi:hypothetical protein
LSRVIIPEAKSIMDTKTRGRRSEVVEAVLRTCLPLAEQPPGEAFWACFAKKNGKAISRLLPSVACRNLDENSVHLAHVRVGPIGLL